MYANKSVLSISMELRDFQQTIVLLASIYNPIIDRQDFGPD